VASYLSAQGGHHYGRSVGGALGNHSVDRSGKVVRETHGDLPRHVSEHGAPGCGRHARSPSLPSAMPT
jgi:hypothetical protein